MMVLPPLAAIRLVTALLTVALLAVSGSTVPVEQPRFGPTGRPL